MTDRLEEAKREVRAAEDTGFIVSSLFKADLGVEEPSPSPR
jgi:hypothetical protein